MSSAAPRPEGPSRVGLLGLGTVGRAVAERLLDEEWRAGVEARGVRAPRLEVVGVRDFDRPRGVTFPEQVRRTDDLASIVGGDDVDVVLELIGGLDPAEALVHRALETGKNVVTANKRLLSKVGPALETAARAAGVALRFEAAVAGGIPLLAPLVLDLAANRIRDVRGIINGTTNFILTAMSREGRNYEDVLAEAQSRGYAEADPTGDVEGIDAADKLAILARLAFGGWPDVRAIRRSGPAVDGRSYPGITGVQTRDLRLASESGFAIKLVADAGRTEPRSVVASVMPVAVRETSPIGSTDGVLNVVQITADPVGVVTFQGLGAGGGPTSSAVLADLLALARGEGSTWGSLPAPMGALRIEDPMDAARGWLVIPIDADAGYSLQGLGEVALFASSESAVTRFIGLNELATRLDHIGVRARLYPILSEAEA